MFLCIYLVQFLPLISLGSPLQVLPRLQTCLNIMLLILQSSLVKSSCFAFYGCVHLNVDLLVASVCIEEQRLALQDPLQGSGSLRSSPGIPIAPSSKSRISVLGTVTVKESCIKKCSFLVCHIDEISTYIL